MNRFEQLQQQIREQLQQAETLRSTIFTANRAATPEESASIDAALARVESLGVELEQEHRLSELMSRSSIQPLRTEPNPTHSGVTPVGAEVHDRAVDRPWGSFGEQLLAVRSAALNPATTDVRLLATRAAAGLNETVGSEGAFMVQQTFSTELLREIHETGQVSRMVRNIPLGANSNGITINGVDETSRANGSRWGGVQVFWEGEADAATATKPKFRRLEFKLRKMIGLCYATDELLADASALESVIRQAFTEEFAFKVDDAIIRGSGGGQPLGILSSPSLVTVSKESGQAAATIVMNNITKMWSRMYSRSRNKAVWFYNQDIEPQLLSLSLTVGNNSYPVFLPPTGLSGNQYYTLYNRLAIPIEHCSTLGTVGDLILMDPSQYGMIDKGGIQSASSIHVKFLTDESTFRFILRTDGRPLWSSALTPYQGAATKSPFVVLETRS